MQLPQIKEKHLFQSNTSCLFLFVIKDTAVVCYTKLSHFVVCRPKFRSYNPQDEELQNQVVPSAQAGDVVSKVQGQLESAKSKVVIDELDISNLAPRKPDWDLKRDVAKKLEKLERRTQKAIAELIRERLRQRQADLAIIADVDPPT